MTRRISIWTLSALAGIVGSARAEAPAIQHDPIACVVAGEFPKLDACFAPFDNLAQARVYFKSEKGPSWYWVDFQRNQALAQPAGTAPAPGCFSAILPKPTKKIDALIYYVEAADKQFEEGRLAEKRVRVAHEKGGCRKDEPVAATVPSAVVSVGSVGGAPIVGFAGIAGVGGGLGAGVIVGGLVAAGGIAGGAAIVTHDSSTPTPTKTAPPATATLTLPPPTPTPSATTIPFNPKFIVNPTKGPEPLVVTFNTCDSTGSNLHYDFDFDGNGSVDFTSDKYCFVQETYTTVGVSRVGQAPKTQALSSLCEIVFWNPILTVREVPGDSATETFMIEVDPDPKICLGSHRNGGRISGSETVPARVQGNLQMTGADRAQLVLDGGSALAVTARSGFVLTGKVGVNRIDLLVGQSGPGTVSFDLQQTPKLLAGSLKVIAGDVVSIGANNIAFHLKGGAGQSVSFSFEVAP